jgi:hypothetical protein
MLVTAFLLNGCSYAPQFERTPIERLNFDNPSAAANGVQQGLSLDGDTLTGNRNPLRLGLSESGAKALGCHMKDRIDRSAALAYDFDDHQTRLALNLSLNGPSFSDPSRLDFKSVMVRYTHKFSLPQESRKEKCRFKANMQGVIGSAYNELFVRDNYTIWQELRTKLKFK